ncbi:hypothetical protein [Escherichia coli]|uniref:hypothetical protein n=1 Tax=Escherichia coli TaxID=562 RepID=UPI0032E40B10
MRESTADSPYEPGPHLHAHTAPTTEQMRIVGQRRREAEEKLEHHLQEARHRNDPQGEDSQGGSESK